jgi:hypothetical protein
VGQLQRPVGVAVLPSNGNIAIADYDNKWISIFDPTGKFMSRIGHGKLLGKHEKLYYYSPTVPLRRFAYYCDSLSSVSRSVWPQSRPFFNPGSGIPIFAQFQNPWILVLKIHFSEFVGKISDTFKRNYLLNFYRITHKICYVLFIGADRICICLPVRSYHLTAYHVFVLQRQKSSTNTK